MRARELRILRRVESRDLMLDLLFTGREVQRKKAANDGDRNGDCCDGKVTTPDVPHVAALNARRSSFSCGASDPA